MAFKEARIGYPHHSVEFPSGIHLDGNYLSFGEIHRKFAQTPYGEKLRQNVRFAPFKPEGVSNEEWVRALGADVNNLDHLPLSYGMTRSFIANCEKPGNGWSREIPEQAKFSASEKGLLLVTAKMHDWAEAEMGDIPYHLKTLSDEEQEMEILSQMMHEILGNGIKSDESAKLAQDVCGILTNKQSKLGKAFSTIEHLGYVRTGVNAYERSKRTSGELTQSLGRLAHEVVPGHLPLLVDRANEYPAIDTFLRDKKHPISAIIAPRLPLGESFPPKHERNHVNARKVWMVDFLKVPHFT